MRSVRNNNLQSDVVLGFHDLRSRLTCIVSGQFRWLKRMKWCALWRLFRVHKHEFPGNTRNATWILRLV
jgi:hypothetical protein